MLPYRMLQIREPSGRSERFVRPFAHGQRNLLPFAIPVAMATWLLLLLNGAGAIKEGQLGPPRQPAKQQAKVVEL